MNDGYLFSCTAALVEIHDQPSAENATAARRRSASRPTGDLFGGVLYIAEPGMPLGPSDTAPELSPGWALGWYPDDASRWLGLREFVAQERDIARVELAAASMRLDLGADGTIDLLVGDARGLADALRRTPIGSTLTVTTQMPEQPPASQGVASEYQRSGLTPPAFAPPPPPPPRGVSKAPSGIFPPDSPLPRRPPAGSSWLTRFVIGGFVLAVLLVMVVVLGPRGGPVDKFVEPPDISTSTSPPPPTSIPTAVPIPVATAGRPPGYSGPAYAGMLVQDHPADASGAVQLFGITATVGRLRTAPANLYGPLTCADVKLDNRSAELYDYDQTLWTLDDPDGTKQAPTIDGTLSVGLLAPGRSVGGTVCFDRSRQSGTFVMVWVAEPAHLERGVWMSFLAAS